MGASQERADFFNATLLVVTRHPCGPPGRPKIHPVLPRFALFFIIALLAIIEPLATKLPATSNASVALVFAPILNPLSVMLCLDVSFILNYNFVFAL
jgi:hypothetical protein